MTRMIIANRLTDGLVVFLKGEGHWTVDIGDGHVFGEAEEAALLEAAKSDEERCIVVEPTVIEVSVDGARPRPVALREAIRAFGPTVQTAQGGAL